MIKLHLGCGSNILEGWINIDLIEHPSILYYDLKNDLPFDKNSVDFMFAEHFLEHLTREEGLKLLKNIYKCLKINGVVRITVPDLDFLIENYKNNNLLAYSKVGWFPKNKCELMNNGMTDWGHKWMYNIDDLKNLLTESVFNKHKICEHSKSDYLQLNNLEIRPYTGEICIEGIKI